MIVKVELSRSFQSDKMNAKWLLSSPSLTDERQASVSSSTPGLTTALNLYTPLYGDPKKPKRKHKINKKNNQPVETKVLQLQIITLKNKQKNGKRC